MPENIIGTVPVVAVRINDGNTLDTKLGTNIFHHNRFNIDMANPRPPWVTRMA